jgi:hypothetical protein
LEPAINIKNLMQAGLFVGLSEKEISTVLNCLNYSVNHYAAGDVISSSDKLLKKIGIVIDGIASANLWSQNPSEKKKYYNKNEVFGIIAASSSMKFEYRFIAETGVAVLWLDWSLLKSINGNIMPPNISSVLLENALTINVDYNNELAELIYKMQAQ